MRPPSLGALLVLFVLALFVLARCTFAPARALIQTADETTSFPGIYTLAAFAPETASAAARSAKAFVSAPILRGVAAPEAEAAAAPGAAEPEAAPTLEASAEAAPLWLAGPMARYWRRDTPAFQHGPTARYYGSLPPYAF
jgi:hypothetical protein